MLGEHCPTPREIARQRNHTPDPHNWEPCEGCDGCGVNDIGQGPDEHLITCPDCEGSGGYEWECPDCTCTVRFESECWACFAVGTLPAVGYDHLTLAKKLADLVEPSSQ
jgi:DnaJ-class molecular chaperone